jgi:CelD/BcsL family acetyltransferase involved in cellulose biosynthesis
VESLYQAGWDPAYADTSVGTLLLAEAIRRAHADRMQEFRFGRGGEPYKYRFTNADPGLETVLFPRPTAGGFAAAGAMLAARRVPRRLRSAITARA